MRNELSSPSLKQMNSVKEEKKNRKTKTVLAIFYSVGEADLQWHIKKCYVKCHSQLKAI